jgi:AraC family transcriptional regulator
MHNQMALCQRTGTTTRTPVAFQAPSGDHAVTSFPELIAESRHPRQRAHGTEATHRQSASKLFSVVSELIQMMAEVLEEDRETADECVRHACSVLLSCANAARPPPKTALAKCAASRELSGRLAPWQVRSLTAHIDANLNTPLRCETLARLVRLSVSHFARKFKYTFGFSPHVFLVRRRVERAQGLMLKSAVPLAQIAADCGFSDQAHFSRLFLQFTGESPGSWRRARACETV